MKQLHEPTIIAKLKADLSYGKQFVVDYKAYLTCGGYYKGKDKHIYEKIMSYPSEWRLNATAIMNYVACQEFRANGTTASITTKKYRFIKRLEEDNFTIIEVHPPRKGDVLYQKSVTCKCNICGNVAIKRPSDVHRYRILKNRPRCSKCNKLAKGTRERFYNKVFDSFEEYSNQIHHDFPFVKYHYFEDMPEGYHLDHKFSIYDCYVNSVPVWICTAPPNIESIQGIENLKKHKKSSVTIQQLYSDFFEWICVHKEYQSIIIASQTSHQKTVKSP
jgi:hypothetical protein